MLNQFPRNPKHVSRLPNKDVPIFLEEFDKHEFLFGVQINAYVNNLGGLLHGHRDYFVERVLQLDRRLGGASGMTGFRGCTRRRPASCLGALQMS
jgi:hypothetical protein